MKYENLPEDLQEEVRVLKHSYYSIQTLIAGAVDDSTNLENFKETAHAILKDIIGECRLVGENLGLSEL